MPTIYCREVTLYQFDELSNAAKERARGWYREGALDYDWWDFVYEDAARMADIIGISLRQKPVKLMNGNTRYDPAIYFSGFSSQGDGACFEGSYSYAKGAVKKICKETGGSDQTLIGIAQALQEVQRRNLYRLEAGIKHSGHYYHEFCTLIDVDDTEGERRISNDDCEVVKDQLRDFMRWIYKRLEQEHDYQLADEQVDESIRANGYTFNEDGKRAN